MNLAEIATFCAAKLGVSNNATTAKAKEFAQFRWKLIWNRYNWRQSRMQQTISVAAGTRDVTLDGALEYVLAVRWNGYQELLVTSDTTMLRNFPLGLDGVGYVTGFDPLPRDSSGNARIRLYQTPNADGTLLVIGKAKCPGLLLDGDSPSIPGADEALVAAVMGDLMQWMRQFTKAQTYFEEATGHLDNMITIERDASANDLRIIPVTEPDVAQVNNWLIK